MSVRRHLLATLVVCFAITLAATYALHIGQQNEAAALTANYTDERQEQLDDEVTEQSHELGLFVKDYSLWDEMAGFVASLDPEWARLNIDEVLESFRVSAVWVLAPDGRILHASFLSAENAPAPPAPAVLARIVATRDWRAEIGGFYRDGERVVDLRARPIQPTADTARTSTPVGWLLTARVLDEDMVAYFTRKLHAEVLIHEAGAADPVAPEESIVVHHALAGLFGGRPVAEVHAVFPTTTLELGEHYNRRELLVLVLSGALLLGVVAWSVNRNVLRPLALIGESLEKNSVEPLAGVSAGLPEFARIADLVRRSFRQQEALRHEIDERARLGRDLHDGVIQNLYATGMGIAHGARLIANDPGKAAARLEETRRTLNETMDNLRHFIARVEPEGAAEVDFADSCVTLFQTLRVDRACALDLDVAPGADSDLPQAQKANLLFIVREAVSNALRHGEARHLAVSLARRGEHWRLEVRDDGKGCALPPPAGTGRGLVNIRARAAELGGSLSLAPGFGGGVTLAVEWGASGRAV
jgi:signal transduction histidine kinase